MSFHFHESIRHYDLDVYDDHLRVASQLRVGHEVVLLGISSASDKGINAFVLSALRTIEDHFGSVDLHLSPKMRRSFDHALRKGMILRLSSHSWELLPFDFKGINTYVKEWGDGV